MDCIVCGKPIHVTGADICSTGCMIKSARGETKSGNRRPQVSPAAAASKVHQMLYAELPKEQEVSMLKIAHPWIKNKNIVQGGIVFSFGEDGVATVKELPGAHEAIQVILKKQRGYFIPKEKAEAIVPPAPHQEAPEPAPEPAKEVEAPTTAPKAKVSEKVSEPVEEPKLEEPKLEEPKLEEPKRKSVRKKPVRKNEKE